MVDKNYWEVHVVTNKHHVGRITSIQILPQSYVVIIAPTDYPTTSSGLQDSCTASILQTPSHFQPHPQLLSCQYKCKPADPVVANYEENNIYLSSASQHIRPARTPNLLNHKTKNHSPPEYFLQRCTSTNPPTTTPRASRAKWVAV